MLKMLDCNGVFWVLSYLHGHMNSYLLLPLLIILCLLECNLILIKTGVKIFGKNQPKDKIIQFPIYACVMVTTFNY